MLFVQCPNFTIMKTEFKDVVKPIAIHEYNDLGKHTQILVIKIIFVCNCNATNLNLVIVNFLSKLHDFNN